MIFHEASSEQLEGLRSFDRIGGNKTHFFVSFSGENYSQMKRWI
jgi:hypothetical protein